MRFVFADSVDTVDPDYDFVADRNGAGRSVHRDDHYPHEFLEQAPYDGILVSRGIVGDARHPGKYSEAQLMRFRREGARRFLRYSLERFPGSMLMGDCGAFTYRNLPEPPYEPTIPPNSMPTAASLTAVRPIISSSISTTWA